MLVSHRPKLILGSLSMNAEEMGSKPNLQNALQDRREVAIELQPQSDLQGDRFSASIVRTPWRFTFSRSFLLRTTVVRPCPSPHITTAMTAPRNRAPRQQTGAATSFRVAAPPSTGRSKEEDGMPDAYAQYERRSPRCSWTSVW